jgi:hypothetical protein
VRWFALAFVLALATHFGPVTSSALADIACIAPTDLLRLYAPGEPPPCPDLNPSPFGRLHNHFAVELAHCAGFLDAMRQAAAERGVTLSDDGKAQKLFDHAVMQRDRPSITDLEAIRDDSRNHAVMLMQDDGYIRSSMMGHAVIQCSNLVREW